MSMLIWPTNWSRSLNRRRFIVVVTFLAVAIEFSVCGFMVGSTTSQERQSERKGAPKQLLFAIWQRKCQRLSGVAHLMANADHTVIEKGRTYQRAYRCFIRMLHCLLTCTLASSKHFAAALTCNRVKKIEKGIRIISAVVQTMLQKGEKWAELSERDRAC